MSVKNRKNLKPCRGFKSFRSLAFRIQFLKNRIFGSSNPSTRRKIENGSMEIRKKLGAKKRRNLYFFIIPLFLEHFNRFEPNRAWGDIFKLNEASPYGDMMFFASLKMMLLHFVSQWCDVCLKMWRSHTSSGEAVIIGEANIICRRQTSLKKAIPVREWLFSWQGQKDSNPRHPVLETGVLPTELYPFNINIIP